LNVIKKAAGSPLLRSSLQESQRRRSKIYQEEHEGNEGRKERPFPLFFKHFMFFLVNCLWSCLLLAPESWLLAFSEPRLPAEGGTAKKFKILAALSFFLALSA